MANTFALTLKAQNNHPASTVTGAVTQQVPDQSVRDVIAPQSAVAEFTSGASNTMAIGAAGIVTVSGTTQKDPVTGSNLALTNLKGVFISCDLADSETAATYAANAVVSTTSLAIGTGSKAFTVAAAGGWVANTRVRAVSAANHANWMEGIATYASTTLTVTVDVVGGSGTLADWTIYTVPCVQVTSTGFGLTASTPINLGVGSSMAVFVDASALSNSDIWDRPAVNGQTLTVSHAGVTGLKTSVFAIGN